MKAMILAAGLGTRLKPLTDTLPKALVVVEGKTLLEHAVEHLVRHGFDDLIVNVHHFGDLIRDFIAERNQFGVRITFSDETGELLDTGGGLKKAAWFFNDGNPFILRNADILSDLDLTTLMKAHSESDALATLAVRQRTTSRYLLFDEENLLRGWLNESTGERKIVGGDGENLRKLAFSGIQAIDPALPGLISETGKFSLTPMYLRLAAHHRICGFEENASRWEDAGKTIPPGYRTDRKEGSA